MIINDKIMYFVLYKKRTENEVRKKCTTFNYENDYIDEIVDYLKNAGYVNDELYIKKYVEEIMKLKHMSVAQIRNDLLRRGIESNLIENIINYDVMNDFELESAQYLVNKKIKSGEEIEKIKRFLLNKGYSYSNVSKAIDNLEYIEDN